MDEPLLLNYIVMCYAACTRKPMQFICLACFALLLSATHDHVMADTSYSMLANCWRTESI